MHIRQMIEGQLTPQIYKSNTQIGTARMCAVVNLGDTHNKMALAITAQREKKV